MTFILEIIGELLFEGILHLGTNIKVSKWIRYPLLICIVAFFTVLAFGLFALALKVLTKQPLVSLVFFAIDGMLLYKTIEFLKKKGKR